MPRNAIVIPYYTRIIWKRRLYQSFKRELGEYQEETDSMDMIYLLTDVGSEDGQITKTMCKITIKTRGRKIYALTMMV